MRIIAFAFAVFACLAKSAQLPSDPDPTTVPPLPGISPGNVRKAAPATMDLAYDRHRHRQQHWMGRTPQNLNDLTWTITQVITRFFMAQTIPEKPQGSIQSRAGRGDQ